MLSLQDPNKIIPANRYVYLFKKHKNRLFPVVSICKFKEPVTPAELSYDGELVFAWMFARDLCNESGILRDSMRRIRITKERNCNFW